MAEIFDVIAGIAVPPKKNARIEDEAEDGCVLAETRLPKSTEFPVVATTILSISSCAPFEGFVPPPRRAIPLPPIKYMKGPIPIFPPNKKVKKFFENLGNVIEIKNEKKSNYLWTTSSLMAPFYHLLLTTSKILQRGGVNKLVSENYTKSLFYGLAYSALNENNEDLKNLIKKSQTPKGLNQQALNELKNKGFYKLIDKVSIKILKRLTE